jgi:hypothetical protein
LTKIKDEHKRTKEIKDKARPHRQRQASKEKKTKQSKRTKGVQIAGGIGVGPVVPASGKMHV